MGRRYNRGVARTGKALIPVGVVARQVEGESVLLNVNTDTFFSLDDVGTRMWVALTGSESIDAAYSALLDAYDVEPGQLHTDLLAFIDRLIEGGMLEVVES